MVSRCAVFLCGLLAAVVWTGCGSGDPGAAMAPGPEFSHVAGAVVDQQQLVTDVVNPLAVGGPSLQTLAQVVTPGVTGRLREIHLPIGCDGGDLIVEIRTVNAGGEPTTTVLHSQRFREGTFPIEVNPAVFQSLNLGARVGVTAGTPFAFVLRSTGSCGLAVAAGDYYPGGDGFFDARPNPPGLIPLGHDLAFETFVTPTGPPVP